jgi:anti-sigma factor RsiW
MTFRLPADARCARVRQHLSEYIDGELESAAAADVRSHLARCPGCALLEAQLEATVSALHRLGGAAGCRSERGEASPSGGPGREPGELPPRP